MLPGRLGTAGFGPFVATIVVEVVLFNEFNISCDDDDEVVDELEELNNVELELLINLLFRFNDELVESLGVSICSPVRLKPMGGGLLGTFGGGCVGFSNMNCCCLWLV